jgi:hypothetical protein
MLLAALAAPVPAQSPALETPSAQVETAKMKLRSNPMFWPAWMFRPYTLEV